MMNANNPQTPGVYTVEKNAFPNSVAQVPTAIPAYVGYTEFAVLNGKPLKTPLMVNSMAEFEQHFGGPFTNEYPIKQVSTSTNDAGEKVIPPYDFEVNDKYYSILQPGAGKMFYLYNALLLFYQNGGGPCYIMSIGNYHKEVAETPPKKGFKNAPNMPDKDAFLEGLEELPKIQFPKPTMILTPDSLLLSDTDYYTVQQQVLTQCGELKDRVGLIDIYDGYKGLQDGVISSFRNNIGNNFLNYGISYYPFLETTIVEATDMTYANVNQDPKAGGMKLSDIFIGEPALPALATITDDLHSVANLVATPYFDFGNKLPSPLPPGEVDAPSLQYPSWSLAFNAFPGSATPLQILQWQMRVVFSMVWVLYELGQKDALTMPDVKISNHTLQNTVKSMTNIQGNIVSQIITLYAYDVHFAPSDDTSVTSIGVLVPNLKNIGITADVIEKIPKLKTPPNPYGTEKIPTGQLFGIADSVIKNAFTSFNKAIRQVHSSAQTLLTQYNTSLENSNANYKTLMSSLAKHAGTLPPSSAMAGVYTLVDNTEGVWMSPANRNINSVIAPTVTINNDQQASLNVDALAGKSINAIRSFFGRGPAIIWGARTLDGNSQDWRYINVRRTMIMIEQSVANAAFQLVFEPNDASTWNSCESMIANFLHNLWAEGALQGSTPAAAYNVSVGLGKTMTPQDILDGIMRVQVKLAIVRPAEFIIITYEQQMATS